jgi:CIC family chloride channel protein
MAIGRQVPQSEGVGYNYVNDIFLHHFSSSMALKIMIAKIIGIVFSIGSGLFGGMMSPSIFIGAFGGYWFGSEAVAYGVDPRVFALVGSAVVLSGISKAPSANAITPASNGNGGSPPLFAKYSSHALMTICHIWPLP